VSIKSILPHSKKIHDNLFIMKTLNPLHLSDQMVYNTSQMMQSQWPKTLNEAVKTCLLTLTPEEKHTIKNTSEENLIMCHFGWAVNMRNEFGM
jgi:hypothetical protein